MGRKVWALVGAVIVLVAGGLFAILWFGGAFAIGVRSGALVAIIVGGVVMTGGLTGVLMWLAFYSSRRGYDQGAGSNETGPRNTPGPGPS